MINKKKKFIKNEQTWQLLDIQARKSMSRKEYQQLCQLQKTRYKSERLREKINSRNNNLLHPQSSTQDQFNRNLKDFDKEVEASYNKDKNNKSLNWFNFKERRSSDFSVRFRSSSRK